MDNNFNTKLAEKYFFNNENLEYFLHSILREKTVIEKDGEKIEYNLLEEIMNVFRFFLLRQRLDMMYQLMNLDLNKADTEYLDIIGELAGSIRPIYNPQQNTPYVQADDDRNVIDYFRWYVTGAPLEPAPTGDITMPDNIYRQLLKSFLLRRVIVTYSVNEMEYLAQLVFNDWTNIQLLLRDGKDQEFIFNSNYKLKTFYFEKAKDSPEIDEFDFDVYVSQDMPIDYQNFLLSKYYNERHELFLHNYPYPANIRIRRVIEVDDGQNEQF